MCGLALLSVAVTFHTHEQDTDFPRSFFGPTTIHPMPELPEVEAARRQLEAHVVGRKITACSALEAGGHTREGLFDDIVCAGAASAQGLQSQLVGKSVASVRRRGKQLWLELSSPPHLLAHFGMTGAFCIRGVKPLEYQEFKVHDEVWPPRFTKLELTFGGGVSIAFCDPRRLGRLVLRADPEREPPWASLAPDALLDTPSALRASEVLGSTSTAIKALLLDQNKLVAGVGNWIADEVLFQAGIHPEAKCNTLSSAQIDALLAAMSEVLTVATGTDGSGGVIGAFPQTWLFHYRWGKGSKSEGAPKVPGPRGGPITWITVGGRTSAVVVSRQRKGEEGRPSRLRPPRRQCCLRHLQRHLPRVARRKRCQRLAMSQR